MHSTNHTHPYFHEASNRAGGCHVGWRRLAMLKLLLLMVNHVLSKTIINHFFERFKLDNVSVHALHGETRCYTLASKRPWKQRSTVAHHQKAEKGQICVFLRRASQRSSCERWKNIWTYPEHFKISRFQRKICRNHALVSSPLKKNTSPGEGAGWPTS